MSGNDTDHFPVKTEKHAFPSPESNVYQRAGCNLRSTPVLKTIKCQVTAIFVGGALNTFQTHQQC